MTGENEGLTEAEWEAIGDASWTGGAKAWRAEVERILAARVSAAATRAADEALREAADAIQALHPGEVKASVTFLRERAARIARTTP